ncbi:MAG: dTDP-4-dehydrorhamnose reductase [Heliobacteriaceae bacterium]|nr:dTDP-4-dehydrorhamnose reductase [Heliobacteriaceae bacterium]MDD4587581.1 dTDP-4-dehydrorhamnose reductase [Heliobacteriaceae bacterium]
MSGQNQAKILLIGKNGQIGWELQRTMAPLAKVIAPGRDQLNLTDYAQIRRVVREIKPHLIVNAAAYTAVNQAEFEPVTAQAINGTAPGILAEAARKLHIGIVQFSTDYVFDGRKKVPYTEEDVPRPLNVYGRTKLAGETAIRATGVPHLILRVSWVYGRRGNNFFRTIVRQAARQPEIKVVSDQTGSPTWSRLIAEATAQILAQTRFSLGEKRGIYHLSAGGQTSWWGFAAAIMNRLPRLSPERQPVPITSRDYPGPARRPPYSVLANEKIKTTFGLTLPSWEDGLDLCLNQYALHK